MSTTIRNLRSHETRSLPEDTEILMVPWDLFQTQGSVIVHDGIATYRDNSGEHIARTKPARLGDRHPGERILVRAQATTAPPANNEEWLLCEVQETPRGDTSDD